MDREIQVDKYRKANVERQIQIDKYTQTDIVKEILRGK